MDHLLYLIDSAGLDTREKVAHAIERWPIKRVGELQEQLWEILRAKSDAAVRETDVPDPFDFVASASMRGEDGCVAWECRIQKAQILARYGALYARRVLIPIRLGVSPVHDEAEDNLRHNLAGTLMSILEYRPLIESGIANLSAGALCYCSEHLAEVVPSHPKIESVAKSLFLREFEKFSVSFERVTKGSREMNSLLIRGPEDYVPHGKSWFCFDARPRWLPKNLQVGRNVKLTKLPKVLVKRSGAVERFFRDIAYDVTIQQYYTVSNNATYLTDMSGEAHVLDLLTSGEESKIRNAIFAQNLLHSVPLLSEVPIGIVIKLRKAEPDAFIQYRAAIARVIQECSKGKGDLTQNDAKRIFADILEPELARLRIQANTIRRAGIKKAAAKTVASFAAVGLGVYGGLLPSDLASLLKMAGGLGLLSQIGESVGLIERNPAEIKNHDLYFLLKLQTLARRH